MRTGGTKVLRLPSLPPPQGPAQSEFCCQGGAGIHARGKDNASRNGYSAVNVDSLRTVHYRLGDVSGI
jgi:hypothetical protein